MRFVQIGTDAAELWAGPYVFLVAKGHPVAYKHIADPQLVHCTQKFHSKGVTRAINIWIIGMKVVSVPQGDIDQLFNNVDKLDTLRPSLTVEQVKAMLEELPRHGGVMVEVADGMFTPLREARWDEEAKMAILRPDIGD